MNEKKIVLLYKAIHIYIVLHILYIVYMYNIQLKELKKKIMRKRIK